MKKKIIVFSICSAFFLSMFAMPADCKEVIGWLERVRVYPGNLKIRAKMDTGAKGSAINAFNVRKFERDKELWVSFELKVRSKKAKNKHVFLEKKVVDSVKIKRKGGGLEERLVVNMDICIGGVHKEIRMSLVDRSNFNYQILIGREDLKNTFIIDPSAVFTIEPFCNMPIELDK